MTRLLVSVTSAAEAIIARDNGADLIDVKDPTRGSLGAQSPTVWREVLAAVGEQVPVSAALGELNDKDVDSLAQDTAGLHFAKVGLANCRAQDDWEQRWLKWRAGLAKQVTPVAVMYADWKTADAVVPADLIQRLVIRRHCGVVLIDTFQKQRGSLPQLWNGEGLKSLCHMIRGFGSQVVLAGSLQLTDLPLILPMQPDYVAVRGAVCPGSRNGPISGELVRLWAQALQTPIAR